MIKVVRKNSGLRDILFDTLEQFVNGKISSTQVKTIVNTANAITRTAALDIAYANLVGLSSNKELPEIPLSYKHQDAQDI